MGIPWYVDIVVVGGLVYLFYYMQRAMFALTDRWRREVSNRLLEAREKRRLSKDPFRSLNGYSWDYVIVYKVLKQSSSSTIKRPPKRKISLREMILRLSDAGLGTKLFYSIQNDEVYLKIRASTKRLLIEADRINYRLLLEPNSCASALRVGHYSGPEENHWKPVQIPTQHPETSLSPHDYIYAEYKPDRYELYQKTAFGSILRGVDRLKLIAGIIAAPISKGGCEVNIYRQLTQNDILGFSPLHDYVELVTLQQTWIRFFQFPWRQDVDAVRDYFGEKIGLYFNLVGHLASFLFPAALFGVVTWILTVVHDNSPTSPLIPYFAVFICAWAAVLLGSWRRVEFLAAVRWGCSDFEDNQEDRNEFVGDDDVSAIDGAPRLYFPRRKAQFRRYVSNSTTLVAIICCLIAIGGIFFFRIYFSQAGTLVFDGVQFAGVIASIANAVQIQLLNKLYLSVAVSMNDYENHRTETDYEDSLILKTFAFQFVNSFVSLFYVAFIKIYLTTLDPCINEDCISELQSALSTIFLTRLALGNVLKIVLPYLKNKMRIATETKGVSIDDVSEVEKIFFLDPFDVTLNTNADYADVIQGFGYTTMFIVAFPLATVVSLVTHYLQLRVDAWRLCQLCRRPEPRSAQDIGAWMLILQFILLASFFTNAGIIVFTGYWTSDLTWTVRIWTFFGIVSGLALIAYIFTRELYETPSDARIQLERQIFIQDKLIFNKGDVAEAPDDGIFFTKYTIRHIDDDPL